MHSIIRVKNIPNCLPLNILKLILFEFFLCKHFIISIIIKANSIWKSKVINNIVFELNNSNELALNIDEHIKYDNNSLISNNTIIDIKEIIHFGIDNLNTYFISKNINNHVKIELRKGIVFWVRVPYNSN